LFNQSSLYPNTSLQAVRRAFMTEGLSADLSLLPSWLARSWRRCLSAGLSMQGAPDFEPISQPIKRAIIEKNFAFIDAARAEVQSLGALIAGLGYFAILTDAHGIVVDVAGKIERGDAASALARVGVDLSEQSIGTSAISTTLTEQQTVWLHQADHFFDATAIYSCAGAPIIGPQGQLLGMVDVTGIRVKEQRQLTHLVAQVAKKISHNLLEKTQYAHRCRLEWPLCAGHESPIGVVYLDDDGMVVAAEPQVLHLVEEFAALGQRSIPITEVIAAPLHQIMAVVDSRSKVTGLSQVFPLWSGLEVRVCSCRPEVQPIKQLTRELILRTVTESRGNVVDAAQRLGVSRATIYRQLAARPK
jgi:sigma-54 dependent transcriptional regulator, acetoin dehydrogenase operon transcriptional activator AcoR